MHYFKQIVMVDAFLLPFATHHRFISFVLYVIGKSISIELPYFLLVTHSSGCSQDLYSLLRT